MTSPLIPVGIAALGSLAVKTMRQLNPGDFLRELCGTNDEAVGSKPSSLKDSSPTVLDLSHAIPAFIEEFRDLLPAALEQPIVLKEDGWGGVIVDGDHPDRLVIEDLLASNAKLREDFQTIARAATSQRDQSAAEFGRSLGEFRLQITGDVAGIGFE